MAALSRYAKDNHVFLTIFIACQCKVHRVVARNVHSTLLCVGKNYAWATKFPEVPYIETPVDPYPWHFLIGNVGNEVICKFIVCM